LTAHIGIILVNKRLDGQFFSVYVYFDTLHVSINRVCRYGWNIHTCIPDGHLYRVTYARCRINTIDSPDGEQMNARNM